jgi:sugar transferase (PEP-CTERM/EpsH1 system associated)
MRVLYVCHRFPYPPNRGGKIRPFHMIRHLAQRHDVTVASLARDRAEEEAAHGIAPHCARYLVERVPAVVAWTRMAALLPTRTPASMAYFRSSRLARRIEHVLRERPFDLVFVHCSSVAQYVEDVGGISKILDFGDMDSQKWLAYADAMPFPLSLGYRLEGKKLERAEQRLARKFDLCTVTTAAEKDTLDHLAPGARTAWFPNGVAFDYFKPAPDSWEPDHIGFLGRMDYYPNREAMTHFCRDVFPLVRKRRPGARLTIVGADPAADVRRLARLPGVAVTGSVKDVRTYLYRFALTVAPLRIARGTQNKILESLAVGVPVVSSPLAARGVDATPGEHLLTADSPDTFAEAVVRVLDDPAERRRLGQAGRERMLSNHSWEAALRRMDGYIEDCFAASKERPGSSGVPASANLKEKA